jgi:hypothetical protein
MELRMAGVGMTCTTNATISAGAMRGFQIQKIGTCDALVAHTQIDVWIPTVRISNEFHLSDSPFTIFIKVPASELGRDQHDLPHHHDHRSHQRVHFFTVDFWVPICYSAL